MRDGLPFMGIRISLLNAGNRVKRNVRWFFLRKNLFLEYWEWKSDCLT